MAKEKDRVCLGAVVGVHGVRGEVKVRSFAEVPEDIDSYGPVENESGDKVFEIKVTGHSKELLRIKIRGIDDRNTALSLKGTGFYVERDKLPQLEDEEEFYHADLIGLKAKLSSSQEVVGEIVGIYNFGAGDLLDIKIASTGKSELLPFTKEYVPTVNIKDGYIIVESVFLNFAADDDEDFDPQEEGDEG